MSGYQGNCAKEEENVLKMENLGINCSKENDGKQYIERNVLVNSPQDKLMGEVLGETAKFEQVLQETDTSMHLYVSDFKGEIDKQKHVYTERKKAPLTFFSEKLAKIRNKMFKKKKQKAGRLEPCELEDMKPENRLSVRSNSHPVKIKIEEEEVEDKEEKNDNVYFDIPRSCKGRRLSANSLFAPPPANVYVNKPSSCKGRRLSVNSLSIHVPVPHPYIHPPVLPPPPPPPLEFLDDYENAVFHPIIINPLPPHHSNPAPPPPDLLDDFNPDFQQPHVNFNPDFENNVFHPIIINPLPTHHNNLAPPPPDLLDDFNPDFQQPHVNFNPDFENNVFHPIIINPLPPHHNNPAPPPPDYLE